MSEKEKLTTHTPIDEETSKKKKKRRKRWWLLPLFFFFPMLWWVSNQKSKGFILDHPSDKALAKLTPTGTQNNSSDITGSIVKTNCFTVKIPKGVFNPHVEEKESSCVIRASLIKPRGLVTISLEKKTPFNTFAEHTGLQFRLKDTDVYKPVSFQTDLPYTSLAFQTRDELIVFIDHPTGVFIISLHSLVKFDESVPSQLKELIQSVTFSES